jgi:hypothetical protein
VLKYLEKFLYINSMFKQLLGSLLLLGALSVPAHAQLSNSVQPLPVPPPQDGVPASNKDQVLASINMALENATRQNERAAAQLQAQAEQLARAIAHTQDAVAKANLLTTRIQLLERKQEALDQNELLVYQANYQSAIVNLISMDKEIKPVRLFTSTRQFFSNLDATGNPINYDGYKEFLKDFKIYISKEQDKEAMFEVVNSLLTMTGDLTKGIPFSGPVAQTMISSTATFVSTLGNKKKEMRQKGDLMLQITAKTAQFTHDKELIADQQVVLDKELNELQAQYIKLLDNNAQLLGITLDNMQNGFFNEQDSNKRLAYLNSLSNKAGSYVGHAKQTAKADSNTPNSEWKNEVYKQMISAQQLKIRFGLVLVSMKENLNQYQELIDKYKADPQIGIRVQGLESSLKQVQGNFEETFSPANYVLAAQGMYKVM